MPKELPAHFMSSFTPIDMAGTDSQIRHVARLIAAQITAAQLGPAAALQVEEGNLVSLVTNCTCGIILLLLIIPVE